MPKYLGRLEQAKMHPGVAVLIDVGTGRPLTQMPIDTALQLMGHRKSVHYVVSIRAGAYHLDREVTPEELSRDLAEILGRRPSSPAADDRLIDGV